MEKRTVLAIVLSTLVFIAFQAISSVLYPVQEKDVISENNTVIEETATNQSENNLVINSNDNNLTVDEDANFEIKDISFSTDLFNVTFNTKGANISSLKLKNYKVDVNESENVDMVLQKIENNSLLDVTIGNNLVDKVFEYKKIDELTHQFSRTFNLDNNGDLVPVTLIKTYKFLKDDYMFELKLSLKNENNLIIPLNSDGSIYSLNVTKQIGPDFEKLDRREDYRRISVFTDGKRDELKVRKNSAEFNESFDWTAIEAKFFTLAVIPENIKTTLNYSDSVLNEKPSSELILNRENLNSNYLEDTYKIYVGPKDKNILDNYNSAEDNGWNISDLRLNKIIKFWFLGMFFMWVLEMMNIVVNNFGLSIILLTVVIKLILYPFTRKSFDSMGKMQTIQPEIQKIQEKYKDDPAKLNAATADLYKKEGVNPLGGCLPMLLQMPIFFTFYSLFNEYIGLRGATFIPGWIVDLSRPEYLFKFGFDIPILNWDAFRLLPFFYLGAQLLAMRFTQNHAKKDGASTGGNAGANAMQTKMMTLGMPMMFFFIMYNQSSGLLLYWITQSLISTAQQIHGKHKSEKEHDLQLEQKLEKKKKKKGKR